MIGKKRSADASAPAGFQRFKDAATGKDYFYNTETGATQWEEPVAEQEAGEASKLLKAR